MIAYYDGERLRRDLLDKDALAAAEKIYNRDDERKSVTSAQLRKFYNDFKLLEKKFESKGGDEEAFLDVLPLVKMMKSKAGYAEGTRKIPKSFADWLSGNVDQINERRDFTAFLLYFEAVVGFCYSLGMSNK